MILPTSITPWYVWTALGIFGVFYAAHIMIYDKKNNWLQKVTMCATLFLLGLFITTHSILNQFVTSNNIIVVTYHRNKVLLDNVVMSMLIIMITGIVVVTFYKASILAPTRKEKYKYIFLLIMFVLLISAILVLKFSID